MTIELAARYRLERRLGRGGGGEVWEALDTCTGEVVAAKLLLPLSGEAERQALVNETTLLSGLEGLGFPRVIALGRGADGQLHQIRELVPGESWSELAQRDPRRALELFPALAEALTVVHRAGLLHGDLKPDNAIVRPDGQAVWVDLGLGARASSGSRGFTPHYAAPEILGGGAPTVRSEVHSLGVVLRDLLAACAALLDASHRAELELVVARATSRKPEERYPSTAELGYAVELGLGAAPREVEVAPLVWPVLGVDIEGRRLADCLAQVESGRILEVLGPEGSGRSALLKRAFWNAGLAGNRVGWLDRAAFDSERREAITELGLGAGGLLFVDVDLGPEMLRRLAERVMASGARLVRAVGPQSVRAERAVVFAVPALDEGIVRRLLQLNLPALSAPLVDEVMRQTAARPAALRRWVSAARGKPLGSVDDVRSVLTSDEAENENAEQAFEDLLNRGQFQKAAVLLPRLDTAQARAAWLMARYEIAAGSAERAESFARAALGALEAQGDQELSRERATVTLGRALLGRGAYEAALAELSGVDGYSPLARSEGLAYRALTLTFLGAPTEGCAVAAEAESAARAQGATRLAALAATVRGSAEWRRGDAAAAIDAYERARVAARLAGDVGLLAPAELNLAGLKKESGDLAQAIELLESAEKVARQAGRKPTVDQALLNLTNLDLYLGRTERARAALARLGDPSALAAPHRAQWHGLRAELAARSGRSREAIEAFDTCAAVFEDLGRRPDASEAWLEPIVLFASPGGGGDFRLDAAAIEARLQRGRTLLDGAETPLLVLSEALLAHARGQGERAEEAAARAAELAATSGRREWEWRSLALGAALHAMAGRTTKSERLRSRAVEVLEEIGAHLPADLREVYWSEPRRRALQGSVSEGRLERVAEAPISAGTAPLGPSGNDVVSRLSQTPLERRLARILAINAELSGEVELDKLATKIVAHAGELLGAERGYLLLGQDAESLTIRASRAGQGELHREFSRSIAGRVVSSGQPLISIDAERDQRLSGMASVHAASIAAVACVPVRAPSGAPIGALYLETRLAIRPDFADELPTLQAFADQAAIAIENARLVGELSAQRRLLETKNLELSESRARLRESLERRTERLKEVRHELRTTRARLAQSVGFRGLVGQSAAMRRIYALIERVQETDVPVLITGESGTGKEVVARAIHEGSPRRERPLSAVNCGAIPESILESELFGHKRGAFTGAERDRKGLFIDANQGTLFLDEIGETPLRMQASLLRVLQEGLVRPVGGNEEVAVDVRVIFATNRSLEEAVGNGSFRADLLFRIRVVELHLPPLRERPEDIPLLVDHFLERLAARLGHGKKTLSRAALAQLCTHPLPGNVRQLENLLASAWVISDGDEIGVDDFQWPRGETRRAEVGRGETHRGETAPRRTSSPPASGEGERGSKDGAQSERERIIGALEQTGWNRLRAAEVLAMPRRTFYRRLREYGIQ